MARLKFTALRYAASLALFALCCPQGQASLWSPLDSTISDDELSRRGFAGSVELGYNSSTGNTESTSYRSRVSIDHFLIGWRNNYALESDFKRDNGDTSQERYKVTLKSERELDASSYNFALADYENDHFNGLHEVVTISAGYGWRAWQSHFAYLDLEAGPGYRRNSAEQAQNELIVRTAAKLEWQLSDTATFAELFSAEGAQKNSIIRSESSISANLIAQWVMKLSFALVYQSNPTDDNGYEDDTIANTDTRTTLTLIYNF